MRYSSETKNIKQASADVISHIKKNYGNVPEDILFDIKLCVEEAVRNAIIHGNKSDKSLSVTVDYKIEKNKIIITIKDQGNGFDVKNVADPTLQDNLYKESGRGVFIIKRFMDKAVYNEKGSELVIEKKLKA